MKILSAVKKAKSKSHPKVSSPLYFIENGESEESNKTDKERYDKVSILCPFVTEEMFTSLLSLSKIHPFDNPHIIDHMINDPEAWVNFYEKCGGGNVDLPGPYISMDVEVVE